MINKVLDLGMPEPQETYSSSPHLYSDLDIPEGSKGRLPRAQQTREGLGAEVLEDLGETGKGAGRRGPSSGGDRDRGGRGGRGGDSRGGRGGEPRSDSSRPASRDGDAPTEGADRPKRNRNRRRTRGGSPSGDTAS